MLHQKEYPDYKYRPKKRQRSGEEKEKERREKGERGDQGGKRLKVKEERGSPFCYQVPSPVSSGSFGPSPSPNSYSSPVLSSPGFGVKDEWAEQVGRTPPCKVPSSPSFPFSPTNVSTHIYTYI